MALPSGVYLLPDQLTGWTWRSRVESDDGGACLPVLACSARLPARLPACLPALTLRDKAQCDPMTNSRQEGCAAKHWTGEGRLAE